MIYVGIDVAMNKHTYNMIDSKGNKFSKISIDIDNNEFGYKKLHNDITKFCGVCNDSNVSIGLESTGIYHENILVYLIKLGYDVMVINPILTNMTKKSKKVHCPKNDNLDAIAICTYLISNQEDFKPYTLLSYHTECLKSLSRKRFNITEEIRKRKQAINNLTQLIFPEFKSFFTDLYHGTAKNILLKYPSTKQISKARVSTIENMIHGRCSVSAIDIINAAIHSVGRNDEFLSFQLVDEFNQLSQLEDNREKYDILIEKYVNEIAPNILSIPGVDYVTAGLILGEIGDVSRFSCADKLISYSGLDIEVYESGKYVATNLHPSKKGSVYLRYALFQVARIIWRWDISFNNYYLKKKAEGKHYYVILGHIQKKLIRVIYSILKNGTIYTPQ